jgi:hypothetical protein
LRGDRVIARKVFRHDIRFGQAIWVEEISAAKGIGLDKVLFWMHDTKRSLSHSFSPGASPKGSSSPKGGAHSPKGPSNSPKGMQPQPTQFFPSYANNTIYELGLRASGNVNFINTPANTLNLSPTLGSNSNSTANTYTTNVNTNINNSNTNNIQTDVTDNIQKN